MTRTATAVALLAIPLFNFQIQEFAEPDFVDGSYESSLKNKQKQTSARYNQISAIPWLEEFLKTSNQADSAADVYPLIEGLQQHFDTNDFSTVNNMLIEIDWGRLSPAAMVTFITATYPMKEELPFWDSAVVRVKVELEALGQPADDILVGFL